MPKKYHYEFTNNPALKRCLVQFDAPPTQVEVHTLMAMLPVCLPQGCQPIYFPTHIGFAVVIHFHFLSFPILMAVRLKRLSSAHRLRERLLMPNRKNLLIKNATVLQLPL